MNPLQLEDSQEIGQWKRKRKRFVSAPAGWTILSDYTSLTYPKLEFPEFFHVKHIHKVCEHWIWTIISLLLVNISKYLPLHLVLNHRNGERNRVHECSTKTDGSCVAERQNFMWTFPIVPLVKKTCYHSVHSWNIMHKCMFLLNTTLILKVWVYFSSSDHWSREWRVN